MNQFWFDLESRLGSVSEDPRRELSLLSESVTGIASDRFLLLRLTGDLPRVTEAQKQMLSALVCRRTAGEPLQYLLGKADFYGRCFSVRPGVLIPRFDTEILVDTALSLLSGGEEVLDLCAGTGCVGLTVGAEKNVSVTEVEKYDDAFSLLRENAACIYPKARLIQADVFCDRIDGCYDLILSNPPYIPTGDIPSLSAEVQKEPKTALDGGDDGLMFYRAVISRFSRVLKPGGVLLFECGIGQSAAIEQMLLSSGFCDPICVRDYGGVERVVGAKKPREVSHV